MASNDVQDVRIESLESRIIAKLHSSVKVLLLFVAAGMGLDFTGLV